MRLQSARNTVKQSRIIHNRASFGESSSNSDTDDGNLYQTSDKPKPARKSMSKTRNDSQRVSEFRTPALDGDLTDYGLEFSTNNIRTSSPRRCSTLQSSPNQQQNVASSSPHRSRNAAEENDAHPSTSFAAAKQKQQTKLLKKVNKQQENQKKTVQMQKGTNTTVTETRNEPTTVVKKRRKQRNPVQLEKRFWREVQNLQNRTENIIPMLPFSRLVREIIFDCSTEVTRITPTAMEGLQMSSELYITQRLQDAYMLTLHRGRITLDVKDMELIKYLKSDL